MTAQEKKIASAVRLLEKHGYTVIPPKESVIIDTTELNKQKLEKRRQAFINELAKYQGTYSNDMLNAFYAYWSESNRSFTKMRYENERTWQLSRRLQTWYNNDKNRNYGRKTSDTEERANRLTDILIG